MSLELKGKDRPKPDLVQDARALLSPRVCLRLSSLSWLEKSQERHAGCGASMVLWLRPQGDPVHQSPLPRDQAIH